MTTCGPDHSSWVVDGHRGIGPVRLGATRAEIEESLGTRSIPLDKGDPFPVAAFPAAGVHAHFDADGRCEAIELMRPAAPLLAGLPPLQRPYADVLARLRERDPALVEQSDGLTSLALGVGLYAPFAEDEPGRPAEGLIVFARGYYDLD